MKICIYIDRHPRSKYIGNSLKAGAEAMGWETEVVRENHHQPRVDILATYGWKNRPLMEMYRQAGGNYFYIDLGYWGRKHHDGDYSGYHKVVLNARHPTEYFQRFRKGDRLDDTAPKIFPWKENGSHIVLAGLSRKGAESLGFEPYSWEKSTIEHIRGFSSRPIIYRPKPSWAEARPIPGTIFSFGRETIHDVLENAHLLVTHYSNAAIDALCWGVPVIAEEGPAKVMSDRWENLESPRRADNREQFLADVSYCHWRRSEIASGRMFGQFLDDGLIRC